MEYRVIGTCAVCMKNIYEGVEHVHDYSKSRPFKEVISAGNKIIYDDDNFHLNYIWDEAKEMYDYKNHDYGNSLYAGYDLIGPEVTVGRIFEKATRMANAVGRHGIKNPEETLLENAKDIFLMSAMLIFKIEEEQNKGEKLK